MRKLILFLAFAGILFTACNDDNKNNEDLASEIAGTYTGTLVINAYERSNGEEKVPPFETTQDMTVRISRNDDIWVAVTTGDILYPNGDQLANVGPLTISNMRLQTSVSNQIILYFQDSEKKFGAPLGLRQYNSNGVANGQKLDMEFQFYGAAPITKASDPYGLIMTFSGTRE